MTQSRLLTFAAANSRKVLIRLSEWANRSTKAFGRGVQKVPRRQLVAEKENKSMFNAKDLVDMSDKLGAASGSKVEVDQST